MRPKRIQRKRTLGWRMPEGAVYVGRPTKWGNPFKLGMYNATLASTIRFREEAAALFAQKLRVDSSYFAPGRFDQTTAAQIRDELRGKDLACWCPLGEPCHADVLLEWANR